MGGTAGTGDDHLDASGLRLLAKAKQKVWRAMRRDDLGFMRNLELAERAGCLFHSRPIALAAHDDGDLGFIAVLSLGGVLHAILNSQKRIQASYIAKGAHPQAVRINNCWILAEPPI